MNIYLKSVVFVLTLFITESCNIDLKIAAKLDQSICDLHKNGYYIYKDNAMVENTIVFMNDSLNFEFNTKTGQWCSSIVKWSNSCTYSFTYTGGTFSFIPLVLHKTGNVKITSVEKDSYNYQGSLEGDNKIFAGTLSKITPDKNIIHKMDSIISSQKSPLHQITP